jgi:GxxExxY protein
MVQRSPLVHEVISCCIEIHRHLGPGLLESAYVRCLAHEFTLRRVRFRQEVPVPVAYKSVEIDCGYRGDFVVDESLLLELKSVERVLPIHEAQVLTYLKLTRLSQALLVNFNVSRLVDGVKSYLTMKM